MTTHWYNELDVDRVLTPEKLASAVPDCRDPDLWSDVLDEALVGGGIEVPQEVAMILAQLGHESSGFTRLVENLNYSSNALIDTFGRHRISIADAERYGRTPHHSARQKHIANILYGGDWGWRNLGNSHPGDGWRYRGRGLIQITGRYNYEWAESAIDDVYGDWTPLVNSPGLAADPEVAAKIAICYWLDRVEYPATIESVTKDINGGQRGLDDRKRRLRIAESYLLL